MKRFLILNFSLLFCLLFAGCGNNRQALPENPIIFNETEIDGHWAIENDGKYYFAYSTIKPKGAIGDFNYALGDCLGYVGDDSNDRIYELSGESSDEWLINYYVNGEMEIPTILRGTSTRYQDYIPESVEDVFEEDGYWIKPEDYIPVEERTKALKENPWDWANNEEVYPIERLKLLDNGIAGYPYGGLESLSGPYFIDFETNSEDESIKRYAIYDRENHKWLFDCFDGGGGGYIQVDDSIDIDTIDVNSCKEKFEKVKEYINSVASKKDNLAIENEQYRFYSRESSEKDNVYITVDTTNLTQDQKYLAENYKMKTNDPSWKIQILNVKKEPLDKNTFKPFRTMSEEDLEKLPENLKEEYKYRKPGEDSKNLFLESEDYSVSKKEFPGYTMFGTLGIQAVDGFIGYSNGYLVSFPYKFPVDAKTFEKSKGFDLGEGGFRVQNNGLQYHHYIGSDKNYFYTREDYDTIVIKRMPKSGDFKVLGTGEYREYIYDKETGFENVSNKFSYDEVEEWDYVMGDQYPPVYKSGNYLYIAPGLGGEYNYGIRRFPVDMETLKDEEFRNFHPIYEYDTTYRVISDKNYYYQIIENENGYRIFQRIKK